MSYSPYSKRMRWDEYPLPAQEAFPKHNAQPGLLPKAAVPARNEVNRLAARATYSLPDARSTSSNPTAGLTCSKSVARPIYSSRTARLTSSKPVIRPIYSNPTEIPTSSKPVTCSIYSNPTAIPNYPMPAMRPIARPDNRSPAARSTSSMRAIHPSSRISGNALGVPNPGCRPHIPAVIPSKQPKSYLCKPTDPDIMIYILGCNSCLQVDSNEFVYLVKIALPKTTSLQDFNELIVDILKDKFPRYCGGFECRFSKQDMDRSFVRIAELATERKVSPLDVPPGLLLPLLGRVFVVLSEPSDLPPLSKHVMPVTSGLEQQLRNSLPFHCRRTLCVDEESWAPVDAFVREDECPRILSPTWDNPLLQKRSFFSPGLDSGFRDPGDLQFTLKVLKEIEGFIQSFANMVKDFNLQKSSSSVQFK